MSDIFHSVLLNFEHCGKFAFSHSEATIFFLSLFREIRQLFEKSKNKIRIRTWSRGMSCTTGIALADRSEWKGSVAV